MAEKNTKVTGVTGGEVSTANVAGDVQGGMGNSTINQQDRRIDAPNARIGVIGDGTSVKQMTIGDNQSASSPQMKDGKKLSSAELLDLVRQAEVSDETVKIFDNEKITGAAFMDDGLDKMLEEIKIENVMDKKKLKILRKSLM